MPKINILGSSFDFDQRRLDAWAAAAYPGTDDPIAAAAAGIAAGIEANIMSYEREAARQAVAEPEPILAETIAKRAEEAAEREAVADSTTTSAS